MTLRLLGPIFFLQPVGIRVFGLSPIIILMMVILICELRQKINILHILVPVLIMNIFTFLVSFDVRVGVAIILNLFFMAVAEKKFPVDELKKVVGWLFVGLVICLLVAFWRYLFGSNLPESYNPSGFLNPGKFRELSISYLPSVRNTDVLYLAVGCFIASYFARSGAVDFKTLASKILLPLFVFAVILSSSRGAILALFATYMLTLRLRPVSLKYLIIAAILIFFVAQVELVKTQIAVVLTVFGIDTDIDHYRSSNSLRLQLLESYSVEFMAFPLGRGLLGSEVGVEGWINSENTFLDILVAYGIFGIGLVLSMINVLRKLVVHESQDRFFILVKRIAIFMMLSMLTNSLALFYFYWFLAAFIVLYLKSQTHDA